MNVHEINHLFSDELYVCGCGQPETSVVLVKKILECMPLYDNRPKFERLMPDVGAQHLILGLLTEANLIEHGSGIGGSWMRDEGKDLLESLRELEKVDAKFESVFDNDTFLEGTLKCDECKGEIIS